MKKLVNVRLDPDLLATFDAWADEQGWTRTKAIERLIAAAVYPTTVAKTADAHQGLAQATDQAAKAHAKLGDARPGRDVTPRLKGMK